MQFVKPRIIHLAETIVNSKGLEEFLEYQGAPNWDTDSSSDSELLIEVLGRGCYNSFADETGTVSQNLNLSKVSSGNKQYIGNIIKQEHGSVIEHASVTYTFLDVSRILTHEYVRHRLASYAQESLRYVRKNEINSYFPMIYSSLDEDTEEQIRQLYVEEFKHAEQIQKKLVELSGLEKPTLPFSKKKKFQSANRRLIPSGQTTHISVTTNHRNWRWLVENRTSEHAEEEIRYAFNLLFEDLLKRYPNIYQDFKSKEVDGMNEIKFESRKI